MRLNERGHQRRGGGKEDRVAGADGLAAQGNCQMRLADPGRNSGILPGISKKCGFTTRFIRGAVRWSLSPELTVTAEMRDLWFINPMEH